MGRLTIEQSLIAARPEQAREDSYFVQQVMEKIHNPVIISSVLRNKSEQHNHKGGLFMNKLRTLPIGVLIAIIIGATALTGGVAYAVYKTVIEPLTVEQTGLSTENGKNKTTFAVEGCPSYEGVSQAEIVAVTDVNSGISSDEARNYVIARCEQNAIMKYVHDMVAAKGVERYDSSTLGTWQPVSMPAQGIDVMDLDVGVRNITAATEFYRDGKPVDRSAIPEGGLVLVAYGGVPSKAEPNVLLVVQATVGAKYYDDYNSGVFQRVPCTNNPSESCFSGIPGYTFYEAVSVHTGPVPAEEQHYADAIANGEYIQLGGVVTHVEGNAFTFHTSTGRNVVFYLPEEVLERELYLEHQPPTVGTEIIITTIGTDRDVISSDDLLSGYKPTFSN